jgi:nucleoside-diphosphate-sugar epimerase
MILVTGASGLIGYEVCRLFDYESAEYGYITNSNRVGLGGQHFQIDLRSQKQLRRIAKAFTGGVIIHCAAVIPKGLGECESQVFQQNQTIDNNIVELALQNRSRIIYLSSTSVYGRLVKVPMYESMDCPTTELSPYSSGKLLSEALVSSAGRHNIILRVNAPYGVRQRNRTVLKMFIENALENVDLSFHGSGERSQDFTHSIDVARLIIKCIESSAAGVFNVSFGQPISMRELAKLVKRIVPGCRSQVVASGVADPQEEFRALFDSSKARTQLDWCPQISIADGIKEWAASFSL